MGPGGQGRMGVTTVAALFEEQAGEFDWNMENVGKTKKAVFAVSKFIFMSVSVAVWLSPFALMPFAFLL
jgi:hypothetical protein